MNSEKQSTNLQMTLREVNRVGERQKNVPKIRFKGYEDAWEQRKLGEVAPVRGGFAFKSELFRIEGVPIVRISNIMSNGTVGGDFVFYDEQTPEENILLQNGSIVIAMSGATTGKVAKLSLEPDKKLYQNQRVGYFLPTNAVDYNFIFSLVNSNRFKTQLNGIIIAGAQPNISSKDIETFTFSFPALVKEQGSIGLFLIEVDNLITLHQRKYVALKTMKKTLLSKMFPKDGEDVPEIRFKGFTDAWEQRKLGSAIIVRSGKDYKHLDEGDVPVYGTGGYMLSVSEALENTQDAIGIGRKGTIDKPFVLKAPFWTVDTLFYCIPKGNNSLGFLYPLFQSINWKLYDESTGVPSLSKTAIEGVTINLTSKVEQYSIGEYFESVDNLITLHQRRSSRIIK